jgi:hypothetical protein
MNACPDLLAALRLRERDLEMDAAALRARLEEVREMIAIIEHPQRKRGRPPGPRAVFTPRRVEPPQHVEGGIHAVEPAAPGGDELPFQSDGPGA